MGQTFNSCCQNETISKMNIFKSNEHKTIDIIQHPPSSITTANIVYGNQKEKITIQNFDVLKVIGSGAFGKVLLVRLKKTHKLYALKLIPKKSIRNKYSMNSILKEREILLKSNHPFILKLRYSFQDHEYFCYVMDYMKGGSISSYLEKEGENGLSEEIVRYYAVQVLLALECLHQNMNVIYRDLKPDNILLDENGNIKLADFGISQVGQDKCETYCGTPLYLAPEILENQPYKKNVDFWNFGCFIYEMLTGENPFQSATEIKILFQRIKMADFEIPPNFSAESTDLVKKLLVADPSMRLGTVSIHEIKDHAFFKGVIWDKALKNEQKGLLNPRFDKDEVMLNALNIKMLNRSGTENGGLNLKGFTYNEKNE